MLLRRMTVAHRHPRDRRLEAANDDPFVISQVHVHQDLLRSSPEDLDLTNVENTFSVDQPYPISLTQRLPGDDQDVFQDARIDLHLDIAVQEDFPRSSPIPSLPVA